MAGAGYDGDGHGADGEGGGGGSGCSFVWDDESQLYYHASSGFYHDPNAGWYYSTTDGLYYRYVDGHYLAWDSDGARIASFRMPYQTLEFRNRQGVKRALWMMGLEIRLHLQSGDKHDASGRLLSDERSSDSVYGDHQSVKLDEVEENRNTAENVGEPTESSGNFGGEDTSRYEENWLAQYGQVVKPEEENLFPFAIVNLWDWRLVEECGKKTNHVSRLVGRLVKQSMKLHPSVPAGGGILKTAPICEVHLDFVRVATGKVYRLRCPSTEYLSTLLTYDSSNPTKNWAFPKLDIESLSTNISNVNNPNGASTSILKCKSSSAESCQPDSAFDKHHPEYRDRAAERRALHGRSGIAPGERKFPNDDIDSGDEFSESPCTAETAIETVNVPFGAQSFGRRVLERMGWKEGEALGRTKKGLLHPLQVAGNKGNAGLGWSSERKVM